MPLIDFSLVKLDIVLQLGKIVASIEQKPVSFKLYSDGWSSYQEWTRFLNGLPSLIVTVNLLKMIVARRLFGFFWWSFVTFVNAFVLFKYICPKVACSCVSAFEWAMRIVKSNLLLLVFLDQNFIWLIRLGLKLVTCSGILVKEL